MEAVDLATVFLRLCVYCPGSQLEACGFLTFLFLPKVRASCQQSQCWPVIVSSLGKVTSEDHREGRWQRVDQCSCLGPS